LRLRKRPSACVLSKRMLEMPENIDNNNEIFEKVKGDCEAKG